MTATAEAGPTTAWRLTGKGYEFCNCAPGCTCNFSGFPSSRDGSCQAVVAGVIESGRCGDVDLSGITTALIVKWPKAIHDGGGKAVAVIPAEVSDEQVNCLVQIYGGQLGGMPWEILATTLAEFAMVRAPITIEGDGLDVALRMGDFGEARGGYFKNPVTGERHEAHIVLPDGFIWSKGECGVGSFHAAAEGVSIAFDDTNWIHYEFDWSN